jgi:hypothetical protein
MTERSDSLDKGQRPRNTILEDLLDADARLLFQVARRMRLVKHAAKGRPALPRDTEKQLWAAFDQQCRKQNLDPRLARQLFALLGGFGLEKSERRGEDKPFGLVPRSDAADIDMAGPRSLARSRMFAVLAAASGQALRLPGVVLNDPLIELVKALNQAGARLSWTDDVLEAQTRPAAPGEFALKFEEQLVFAGDEPFTLYALLALALREAGRSKFAGGAGLKMLDLRALGAILPHLGARLAPMNPRAHGLPARLESGGRMASRVELTPDTPPAFAQALALVAWSYPEGLRLALPDEASSAARLAAALDEVMPVLSHSKVPAKRQNNEFVIPAAQPKLPAAPELPLDPALCAYLLALPAFAGGQARLTGALELPPAVAQDFAALGLAPEIGADAALCRHAALEPGKTLGMGADARLFPLALALALRAGSGRVALPAGNEADSARAWAVDLLERLGAGCDTWGNNMIGVTSAPQGAWEGVWSSPSPYATLALALLSFLRPGIALDNPGELAGLWPRFWGLYNALPLVRDLKPAPKAPEPEPAKPRRKRVRV